VSTDGNDNSPDFATPPANEALEFVAHAMDRVQQEIDQLWRLSVSRDNANLSDRLVEVSHALQRAARLLEEDRGIG